MIEGRLIELQWRCERHHPIAPIVEYHTRWFIEAIDSTQDQDASADGRIAGHATRGEAIRWASTNDWRLVSETKQRMHDDGQV